MAKAFKQHILMWVALVGVSALVVGVVIWLKNSSSDNSPQDAPQTEQTDIERTIPPPIELRRVVGSLSAPVDIAANNLDGDSRLYIVEQGGLIKILDGGQLAKKDFLDLSSRVVFSGEQGLLGLVFDPNFADNNYFYINYVEPTASGRRTVISRFTSSQDGSTTDMGSEKRIMTVDQPYANHNGGDLNFGPDGYLYVGLGDGGSSGDPENRAQSPNSFLGKILRIDVDSDQAYDVPENNPFAKDSSYRPEIWSTGWRNPWRFSFDGQTGDMWIADVGQNEFEEINREPAATPGRNYGWRCFEAADEYNTSGCSDSSNYVFPVAAYEHSPRQSCSGSVSGGYVYRGQDYPQLGGFYFYADYCTGQMYSLDSLQATYTSHPTLKTDLKITTFGQDNRHELYLADAGEGTIYQLVAKR